MDELMGQDIARQRWFVVQNGIPKRAVCYSSRCEQIYMGSSELLPNRLYQLWVDTPLRRLRLGIRQ